MRAKRIFKITGWVFAWIGVFVSAYYEDTFWRNLTLVGIGLTAGMFLNESKK